MKLPALQTITSVAAATLLGAASARAVEITPTFDLSGYIVGSGRYVDQGDTDTTIDLDASKLLAGIKTGPVSGTMSVFAAGTDDISLLDAYFTYEIAEGTSVTAGKFLSYHGYEAFDIPNMLQITYSNENSEAIIPGYHKGVRLDMVTGDSKFGFALVDSVYASDGEIEDGVGLEGYYVHSAGNKTAYLGVAYDSTDFGNSLNASSVLADFWLQVDFDSMMVAGEVAYKTTSDDLNGDVDSYFVSALAQFAVSESNHVVLRVCIGEDDYDVGGSEGFTKFTLAARQKVSDNFTVVEEMSYTTFDTLENKTFLGVQGRFTF